ncbi:hypothetical protein SZ29_09050 [Burkholderia pseudomallei]|nr:hypothetical protein SZ29_09050 [Burkholderia pseudomallei]
MAADVLRYSTAQCYFGHILVARSADGVCDVLVGRTQEEVEATFVDRNRGAVIQHDAKDVRDDLEGVIHFMDRLANRWPVLQC